MCEVNWDKDVFLDSLLLRCQRHSGICKKFKIGGVTHYEGIQLRALNAFARIFTEYSIDELSFHVPSEV